MFETEQDAGPADEPDELSAEEQNALVARARELATQISVLQAEYAVVAARIAERATPAGARAGEWLSMSTGVMPNEAARSLRIGRAMEELPGIAEAFARGSISEATVAAMAKVATPANEAALLEAAAVASGAQLLKVIRSYQRTKPKPEPDQEPLPAPEDYYTGYFDEDGRYRFRGNVNGELGATMHAALRGEIEADWRRRRDEAGSDRRDENTMLSQAEALADVFAGHAAALAAGRSDGVVPTTHQAILHLDKAAIDAGWTDRAAHLQDGGAVDPAIAQRMACDAAWRAVITIDLDPEGVTREKRLAGPGQRAAAFVRDGTCCFPGCGRTRWLKLHHLDPHAAGGATRLDNLICLCQKHHTLIHKPGWQIQGSPRTGLVFLRPDGSEVRPADRPSADELPAPPPADPGVRYLPTGEPLTHWAHDMLLAHWLSCTDPPMAAAA